MDASVWPEGEACEPSSCARTRQTGFRLHVEYRSTRTAAVPAGQKKIIMGAGSVRRGRDEGLTRSLSLSL